MRIEEEAQNYMNKNGFELNISERSSNTKKEELMNLQNTENKQYPCLSSIWDSNMASSISMSGFTERRIGLPDTYEGEYWKSNYYVFLQSGHHGFASHCQLQDEIEIELLREHKEVILNSLFDICNTQEVSNLKSSPRLIGCGKISESELEGNFIEILIQMEEFQGWEAKEFVNILRERLDCRRVYYELISVVKAAMLQTFTYLFYFSIKVADQSDVRLNIGLSYLDLDFEKLFDQSFQELRVKLRNLPEAPSLKVNLKKITFSIVMALSGVFVNKFYDPKSTPNFEFQIPQSQPQKKIKHIASSRRRIRSISTPHFQTCKKIKF